MSNSDRIKVLYLSLDGMTDPLGQSQVIAYLKRISAKNVEYDIVSFEKPDVYQQRKTRIEKEIAGTSITWHPLEYSNKYSFLSTYFLLQKGWKKVEELHKIKNFDIVHCRAQLVASLGCKLKDRYGVKFIFDMRGWWTDEKFESGARSGALYRPLYKYLKNQEQKFFRTADTVVSLTHVGKEEIVRHHWSTESTVGVIPTCVDFETFQPFSQGIRNEIRAQLGIPEDAFVLIYSGSLGGAYNVGDILRIYKVLQSIEPGAQLLLLAKTVQGNVKEEINTFNLTAKHKVKITSAEYKDVHKYLMSADLGLILYEMTYSVIGRSPTKLGEYWSSGIPVLSPAGIGDVDYIINRFPHSGALIKQLNSDGSIKEALQFIMQEAASKDTLRNYAVEYYDINNGVDFYYNIYTSLKEQR
ncbi:glycosyltransferase [Rufibacter ruber]|uniref:glycosyltransferase n=1 Tax=Rufibacter ruber TaxID=1783499 RepID=UPI00082D734C|nr:glycosyltransferase [Rufibacter ruber]